MSTRSRIAIEKENGYVDSIYCHFDGYVSGVGKTLFTNYDRKKLNELIQLGDISALEKSTEDTIAYHRDRNEDLCITTYLSVESLFENGFESGVEYVYCLTKDDIFLVCKVGSRNVEILKEAIEE